MKCLSINEVVFVVVCLEIVSYNANCYTRRHYHRNNNRRPTRQDNGEYDDDRWIWGYVDETTTTTSAYKLNGYTSFVNNSRDSARIGQYLDDASSPRTVATSSEVQSTSELMSELRRFREEIRAIREDMKEFTTAIADLTAAVNMCNLRIDEIASRVDAIDQQTCDRPVGSIDVSALEERKKSILLEATTEPSIDDRGDDGENPCNDDKQLEKPDFRAPGRRLSEEKCYEYLWNIKFREESARQFDRCLAYMRAHPNPNYPLFAIGGRNTEPGEFPHMGAIGWKSTEGGWVFKCGSTLISSNFVLTAAHCTRISDRDTSVADLVPKIVRLGEKNILSVPNLIPYDESIKRIIVHPEYVPPKKYFDIALMELENNVIFSSQIQPACIWTFFDTSPLGTSATVTGWGVVSTGDRQTSPELQASVVDIIDSQTCDSLLLPKCNRLWCGVQDSQICAGKLTGGVDACWGDSGGPLQRKINLPPSTEGVMHYVIGVTSFGFGCALENTPGVYTRVSYFLDWIESTVWN